MAASAHITTLINATFDTTTFNNGLRAIRVNPAAAEGVAATIAPISGTVAVWRYYINVASAPTANRVEGACAGNAAVARIMGLAFNTADSKWYPGEDDGTTVTLGAAGVTLSAGWHYVDVKVNVVANPWTIDVQVDGTPLTQLTRALAADTLLIMDVGNRLNAATTCDIYCDDLIVSLTAADYPIGAGYVNHFVTTSDGTHTATLTHIVKGTLATPVGVAITSATTDAFKWESGVPLLGGSTDNTMLINQQTLLTTEYVELVFGPAPGISTPTVAPRAVEVITADRQATTATGSFATKLNDNGTENAIITRTSVAGSTVDRFVTKQYALAPTGGAWTVSAGAGNFNNIRARFGYSGDATPDQYWRGIMIEAEFAAIVASSTVALSAAIQVIRQAINRSASF